MKKVILIIASLIGLLFLSDFIYKTYKRNERVTILTDDRAVLFVYLNIDPTEIKDYFKLDDSLYQEIKSEYALQCYIPDYETFNLINVSGPVELEKINCDTEFNFHTQFEMKKEYQDLSSSLKIKLSTKTFRGRAIAEKYINVSWEYGKVNHIVVEKEKSYVYCAK